MTQRVLELLDYKEISFYSATNSKHESDFIYKEIFEDKCYDGFSLSKTPFIINAGANIGLFSLYMKQKYPSSRILAFEPAPETLDVLSRNLKLHNLDLQVFPIGLYSKAGTAKFTYFPNLPGNLTLRPEEKKLSYESAKAEYGVEAADQCFGGAQEFTIKLQRLSNVLNGLDDLRTIDLLKIDVEGAELDVLRRLDNDHWALVRNIVIETAEISGVRAEIEGLLQEKGFVTSREAAAFAPERVCTIRASRDGVES